MSEIKILSDGDIRLIDFMRLRLQRDNPGRIIPVELVLLYCEICKNSIEQPPKYPKLDQYLNKLMNGWTEVDSGANGNGGQ